MKEFVRSGLHEEVKNQKLKVKSFSCCGEAFDFGILISIYPAVLLLLSIVASHSCAVVVASATGIGVSVFQP